MSYAPKNSAVYTILRTLSQAWESLHEADIEISPQDFEEKLREKYKDEGINCSDELVEHFKETLRDPITPKRIRNLIIAECEPEELKDRIRTIETCVARILELIEYAYEDLLEFLKDREQPADLKYMVYLRLFLPAQAHHLLKKNQKISQKICDAVIADDWESVLSNLPTVKFSLGQNFKNGPFSF